MTAALQLGLLMWTAQVVHLYPCLKNVKKNKIQIKLHLKKKNHKLFCIVLRPDDKDLCTLGYRYKLITLSFWVLINFWPSVLYLEIYKYKYLLKYFKYGYHVELRMEF